MIVGQTCFQRNGKHACELAGVRHGTVVRTPGASTLERMTDKHDDADSAPGAAPGGASSPFDQQTEEIPVRGSGPEGRSYGQWDPAARIAPSGQGSSTSRWSRLGHPVQTARFTAGAKPNPPGTGGQQGGAAPPAAGDHPTEAQPTYSEVVDEDDLAFGGGATEQIPLAPAAAWSASPDAPAHEEPTIHEEPAIEEIPVVREDAAATTAPVHWQSESPATQPEPVVEHRTEVMQRPATSAPTSPWTGGSEDAWEDRAAEVPAAGAPTAAFAPLPLSKPDSGYPPSAARQPSPPPLEDSAWSFAPAYQPVPAEEEPRGAGAGPAYAAQPVYVPGSEPTGRGTVELGLLLLRLLVGGLLILDGLRNTVGLLDGPGLSGTEALIAEWGFDYARILAIALVSIQLGAGVLIVVGLATPFAAAAVVLAMSVFTLGQHLGNGNVLVFSQGVDELPLILAGAAAALALTGPGKISLDSPMKWSTRPRLGSFVLLVLGVVGGVVAWLVLSGKIST